MSGGQKAFRSACPEGHELAGSPSAAQSAPREGLRLAHGAAISVPKHSPPASPVAEILEAPSSCGMPTCACGCGIPVSIARRTDARTGAVAGQPLKFLKGHAARLHNKLEFCDITPAWFDADVILSTVNGCWLADAIQMTIEGRRVYTAHLALLLRQGLPVTANALDWLRVRRCRRNLHCVRPDHMVDLEESPPENVRRGRAAIEAARPKAMANRTARPERANQREIAS